MRDVRRETPGTALRISSIVSRIRAGVPLRFIALRIRPLMC